MGSFDWERILNTLSEGVCLVDGEDDILYANRAARDLFRLSPDGEIRLKSKDMLTLIPGAPLPVRRVVLPDGMTALILKGESEEDRREEHEKNEERRRLAMEFSRDGLFDWNLDTNEIYFSPAWKSLLGYQDHELPNRFSEWERLTDKEGMKASWEAMNRVLEKKEDRFHMEFRMRHKDGHWVDILSRANVIFDESGKGRRVVGTHTDISDLKRIERRLEASQKELREAQRIGKMGSWSWDLVSDRAQGSEEYFRLLGLSWDPEGLSLEDFYRLIHPGDRERLERALRDTLSKGTEYNETYRIVLPGGEERIHNAQAELTHDREGKAVGLIGTQLDLTELKRAEDALKQSEHRLSLAMDAVSDAVWDWRIDTGEVYFSSRYFTMLGYEPGDFASSFDTWEELLHPEDFDRAHAIIEKSLAQGESFDMEFRMKTREGAWKWILGRGKMVEADEEGRPLRMLGTHMDIDRRKEYEQEILKQKRTAESYLNLAGVLFIDLDLEGNLILANDYAARLLGYSKEELVGMNWFDHFLEPDIRSEVARVFKGLIRGEGDRAEYFENTIVTRSKQIRLISWHNTYIKNEKGEMISILSAGEDITEKRALQNLYRSIVQTSLDGFMRVDAKGDIIEVNRAYCLMVGYDEDELLGMNIGQLEAWEREGEVVSHIKRIKENGYDQFVTAHRHREGGEVILETNVQYRPEGGGQTVSFLRDITERRRQERELNFQALLLNQIQDWVTATDLEGNVMYVNDSVCQALGMVREEILGRPVVQYGENRERGASQDEIVKATLEKGEWHGEVVNYDRNGREHILDCRTRLIRDGKGRPESMVGISTDITEKKLIAEQLRQSQKLDSLGSLAGGIAHDFNNILTPIMGMAELIQEELAGNDALRELTQNILEASERGAGLVRQILAFSRKSAHQFEPVSLQDILREAGILLRATIPVSIEIHMDADPGCGRVKADPNQLHQVIMNLATNAFHAVESAGGRIDFILKETALDGDSCAGLDLEPGRYARLSVEDNGVGMDRDVIDKIFDPYFSTKGVGKGTGLGLAVVYGIVKEHRGGISVESKPGRGTLFHLFLPLAD